MWWVGNSLNHGDMTGTAYSGHLARQEDLLWDTVAQLGDGAQSSCYCYNKIHLVQTPHRGNRSSRWSALSTTPELINVRPVTSTLRVWLSGEDSFHPALSAQPGSLQREPTPELTFHGLIPFTKSHGITEESIFFLCIDFFFFFPKTAPRFSSMTLEWTSCTTGDKIKTGRCLSCPFSSHRMWFTNKNILPARLMPPLTFHVRLDFPG